MRVREQLVLDVRHDAGQQLRLPVLVLLDKFGQVKHGFGLEPVDLLQSIHDGLVLLFEVFLYVLWVILSLLVNWLLLSSVKDLDSPSTSLEVTFEPLNRLLMGYFGPEFSLELPSFHTVQHSPFSLDDVLSELHKLVDTVLIDVVEVEPWNSQDGGELLQFLLLHGMLIDQSILDSGGYVNLEGKELLLLGQLHLASLLYLFDLSLHLFLHGLHLLLKLLPHLL